MMLYGTNCMIFYLHLIIYNSQDQVGRAEVKGAAAAYLAKLNLYQAYKQNDAHQVTSIDAAKLQKVIDYADKVTGALVLRDYGNNFFRWS
jgi:hypothetical protein